MAKLYASEIAVKAADDCVQIHGGYGFVKDYPAEKYFRDVKLAHHRRRHERDPAARDRAPAAGCADVTDAVRSSERVLRGRPARASRAPSRLDRRRVAAARRARPRASSRTPAAPISSASPARPAPARARSSIGSIARARAARHRPSASSPSIRPARSPAARSSAIASACRRTRPTPACSSAAWRRAATSAASRARPAMPRCVLDAAGKDVVLIETVGVGQDEVDIVRTADVSIVDARARRRRRGAGAQGRHHGDRRHLRGEQGRPRGRRSTVASIEAMLSLQTFARRATGGRRSSRPRRRPGQGVAELLERDRALPRPHRGDARRAPPRARRVSRLRELLAHRFLQHVERDVLAAGEFDAHRRSHRGARDSIPTRAADEMLRSWRSASEPTERSCMKARARSRRHRGRRSGRRRSRSTATRSGWRSTRRKTSPSQRVRAHFIPAGEPRSSCSRRPRRTRRSRSTSAKRGPGLHHITLRVDDIDAALAQLQARGVRLIDEQPRPARTARSWRSSIRPPRTACWWS